jgi:hypothetical protein
MMSRFDRNYSLIIELKNSTVEIKPPMQIAFKANKSIYGGLNKATVQIYNLQESTRLKLVKDPEDNDVHIPFSLAVGYGTDLDVLFKGSMYTGSNARSGVDFITTIESLDGGFDFLNSFTSKTVKTKDAAIDALVADMPNTSKGFIAKQTPVIRPVVMVGNTARLIQQQLKDDETYYIDNETLYIIKKSEVTGNFVPVVSAETGLMNTPDRQNKRVTFQTLLNPAVKIGNKAKLVSLTTPHLNGIYKVEDIGYAGDYYGSDWMQEVTGVLI